MTFYFDSLFRRSLSPSIFDIRRFGHDARIESLREQLRAGANFHFCRERGGGREDGETVLSAVDDRGCDTHSVGASDSRGT